MRSLRDRWTLDPSITFLNHGSFGACPRAVLDVQAEWRARMERQPVLFLARELETLLDEARTRLAQFLGADREGLAFVRNATEGVNSVLRSLHVAPGDELVTTTHEYNASRNILEFVAAAHDARVVVADVPFPIASSDEVVDAIVAKVTPRTRLLLVDHVTSQTALVFPIGAILREMNARGIDVFVDGAHAPGMLPLDLGALGAAYYTGNCHKWICAPKGAAFLHVREDRRAAVRPACISHGANSTRDDRSRFLLEFDWTGTLDPTAILSIPAALEAMASMDERGWRGVMEANRALALRGRDLLCATLGIEHPAPDSMIGSMAAVPLPNGVASEAPSLYGDPLQDALWERHRIEVPVIPWPAPPKRLVRISAQLHNELADYERLGAALPALLDAEAKGDRR
ncbi:MAG: aminotransferase class V-fold PLP-dependent enzyme [Thermoanaerobaculia bacterium]|jgi:isopenicillin-N epimerase